MLWAKEDLATAIFPQSMASLCDGLCIQELDEPDLITKILLIWAKGKKPVPLVQEFPVLHRRHHLHLFQFLRRTV